jgi:hypothetical protein
MGDDKKALDPKPAFSPISDLYRRVDEVLDRIRPYVQLDGGHVELVDVNERTGSCTSVSRARARDALRAR